MREIRDKFRLKSLNGVNRHLTALAKKGALRRIPGRARAFEILGRKMGPVLRVPLLGCIPAGLPESAMAEAEETVAVDQCHCASSGQHPLFALRVRGFSMIGAAIKPDDIAIFEIKEPRVGDIVAALVDGAVTLKRLAQDGSRLVLRGENPDFSEIKPRDELQVQGVLVNIQRAVN